MNDWAKWFANYWTACDGCSLYISEFKEITSKLNAEQVLQDYFPAETYQRWKELPEQITVYRGAFASCKNGLSWSLDYETAEKFALTYHDMSVKGFSYLRVITQINEDGLIRLDKHLAEPVGIYQTTVNKNECLLFDSRGEEELFILHNLDDSNIKMVAM